MNARIYEKRAQMSKTRKAVKLVSAEGFEFYVDYRAACVSNTIKQMLSSTGAASVCRRRESILHCLHRSALAFPVVAC